MVDFKFGLLIKTERLMLSLRLKIKKHWRQKIVILITVLLIACAVGLLWSYAVPSEENIDYEDYQYLQKAELDYAVHLVANEVFPEEVLYPGRVYVTALTDYITVNFTYRFSGDQKAEINGNYIVTAELAALMAQDREDQLLWEKKNDLISRQSFTASDREIFLQETFIVPFSEYQELIGQIQNEINVSPAVINLIVKCSVNLTAEVESGLISENLEPTMVIPMRGATFYIEGNLVEETEGNLIKTFVEPVVLVQIARTVLPFMVVAALIFLILFLLLTASTGKKINTQEREISIIMKKNQDQIIKIAGNIPLVEGNKVALGSIEDLLRLSDEVAKPVLYTETLDDIKDGPYFIIYTPELVYYYRVGDSMASTMIASRKDRFLSATDLKSPGFVGAIIVLIFMIFIFSFLIISYV